ncbi:FERM, ARHGEF and pleckstrin domain-containing protein 2-like isoform X2 [Lycorma delicatula]
MYAGRATFSDKIFAIRRCETGENLLKNVETDDSPLASLPLLGYSISTPTEKDGIHKDYVFKLQFKNCVFFFRAESEYTFSR